MNKGNIIFVCLKLQRPLSIVPLLALLSRSAKYQTISFTTSLPTLNMASRILPTIFIGVAALHFVAPRLADWFAAKKTRKQDQRKLEEALAQDESQCQTIQELQSVVERQTRTSQRDSERIRMLVDIQRLQHDTIIAKDNALNGLTREVVDQQQRILNLQSMIRSRDQMAEGIFRDLISYLTEMEESLHHIRVSGLPGLYYERIGGRAE